MADGGWRMADGGWRMARKSSSGFRQVNRDQSLGLVYLARITIRHPPSAIRYPNRPVM